MKQNKAKNSKQGFTLLELLIVVLIIGILASIALPQYQMAVTKAKVASILPIMRRWKDALMEYKLQHGDYCPDNCPTGNDIGVSWPSDWEDCSEGWTECTGDYWNCYVNDEVSGDVTCRHEISDGVYFDVSMRQPDDPNCEICRDKIMCFAYGEDANKVCKALGGKIVESSPYSYDYTYSL